MFLHFLIAIKSLRIGGGDGTGVEEGVIIPGDETETEAKRSKIEETKKPTCGRVYLWII